MSGSNWAGPSTDARNMFEPNNNGNSIDNNDNQNILRSNSYLDQGCDGGMPSLYRRPTQEEISAVLFQYAAGPSSAQGQLRPPMFVHPLQMLTQSRPSGGSSGGGAPNQHSGSNGGMEADAAHRAATNQIASQGTSLDPAAAAAAAAYGHLGYGNAAAPLDPSRRTSAGVDPKGHPGQHSGMNSVPDIGMMSGLQQGGQMLNSAGALNPMQQQQQGGFMSNYSVPDNGFVSDGGAAAIGDGAHNDDFGPGKKRRMMSAGQFQTATSPPKPGLMHHDSLTSMMHDYSSIGSTPLPRGPDGLQQQHHHFPARPPLLHRKSRSGSELAGNMPSFSGFSFDSFSDVPDFSGPGPGGMNQAAPVYLSSHSHQASFGRDGNLPPSALGGHAASHPPGLGSQILRGVDVSARSSSAASDFTKRKGWTGRVVEELLDFVHVLDPDGFILFASPSAYSLTGWTSDELRGRKLIEFIHPQDAASVEREIDRMRSGNGELLTYYRFKTKSKSFATGGGGGGGNDMDATTESTGDGGGGEGNDDKEQAKCSSDYSEAFTRDGEYVVFEASGHPYFPPKPPSVPSSGVGGEGGDAKEADAQKDRHSADDAAGAGIESGFSAAAGFRSESMINSASASKQGTRSLSQSNSLDTPSEASSQLRSPLQCFFCSARPYPSKNTSMLDSFLELKLENEKLRLLIADMDLTGPDNDAERANCTAAYHPDLLKQELEGDSLGGGGYRDAVNPMFGTAFMHQNQQQQQQQQQQQGSHQHHDQRFAQQQQQQQGGFGAEAGGGATRRNSLGSHPTSPTMRTSVVEDLLANVIGTGNESGDDATSPNAAGGGAPPGSQGAMDDSRRKKKPKQDDGDHVCTDCGRVDSPEWRKGPLGPKTLCNACGLRWAKKIKRKGGDPTMAGMLVQPPGAPPPLLGHGHPLQHSFGHDGQMQTMGMPPPGAVNVSVAGMGLGQPGMMPTSPIFSTRQSFDESQGRHHGPS